MAKFGQLFLQDGVWAGEQVVSREWVAESTAPRLTVFGDVRYGYHWWFIGLGSYDVPLASGYGGQRIHIVPELDLVIVTSADYSDRDSVSEHETLIYRLVEYWILPAVTPTSSVAGAMSQPAGTPARF
ncbi:MAG: hypothetical protein GTO22_08910 [Gemmatimonadales bacterium]|nr:hypothetical protein [Gemmatimonadales bacterium]